jgi:6-phosphogluconate dehydrogenase
VMLDRVLSTTTEARLDREIVRMQLGMLGLGRMGSNMVRRLMKAGHECVVYDVHPEPGQALQKNGAVAAGSLEDLFKNLAAPRTVWMMLPAAIVDDEIASLIRLLDPGDTVVDGGNSH